MKNVFNKIVNVIFIVIMIYLALTVIFQDESIMFDYDIIKLVFATIFILAILTLVYKFIRKEQTKRQKIITIVIFFAIIIIQIIVGYLFNVVPSWDLGRVYREAIDFNGTNNGIEYFLQCPNNIPLLMIFKGIFGFLNIIGITAFQATGMLINLVIIDLSIFLTYRIIKKYIGTKQSFMFLIIMFIMPTTYLYIPIFYTDTLSMIFPVLILYTYLKIKEKDDKKLKILLSIIMGIIIFIGINIKFTILIIFLGICIYEIFLKTHNLDEYKKIFTYIVIAVCVIIICTFVKNILYKTFMDRFEEIEDKSLPFTHFIMMSLKGDGRFNQDDVDYTTSFETHEEKIKANIEEIIRRANEHTQNGDWLEFINNKIRTTWGDGTFYIPWQLERNPIRDGIWQEFIFRDGKYAGFYKYYSQALYVSMLIFILISVLEKDEKYKNINTICRLTFIGIFLIFVIWEAKSRYIVNYIPIFIVLEVIGLSKSNKKLKKFKLE